MTLRNYLISIGTACAFILSFAIAEAQTSPLPPGLVRAGSSSSNASSRTSLPPVVQPASTPAPAVTTTPATAPRFTPPVSTSPLNPGTRTAGSNLLGLPSVTTTAATASTSGKTNSTALKFENAESYIVLMAYAAATGRTLIIAPDAPKATITLKSQPDIELTKEEYLEAIEKTLAMNSIVLEPDGTKFLKVFAKGKVRTEGIKTIIDEPDKPHPELGRTISQMITFKHLAVAEGQKALEGFKKPDGLFQVFERTNTILVTDTQENINRMLEIVKFIDQPIAITDEVNVRTIKYAKADDIKKRIEELVAESQKQQQAKEEIKANASGSPGISRTPISPVTTSILGSRTLPPGLVRPGSSPTPVVPNETLSAMISDADRGMIRGKVQVIADERSNKLIIVTRPENMMFFDKIIEVLDIPTTPEIEVEIIPLDFAMADTSDSKDGEKSMLDILNELIGKGSTTRTTTSSKSSSSSSSNKRSTPYGGPGGNQNLTSAAATPAPAPVAPVTRAPSADRESTGKIGELSAENITILADKRSNSIIVMGRKTDIAQIKALIRKLDMPLQQVIIETVLLQVQLTDTIKTGIDWIHSSIMSKNHISAMGAGGGGSDKPLDNLAQAAANVAKVAGSKYYFLFDKLDLNMVVSASKEDSRVKVLQSPVLMTVNNKEATLESTDMRYLYKGVRYAGGYNDGREVPDYEQRDFGVTIKVTPRINQNGLVHLKVDQKFETLGTPQFIPGAGGSTDTNSASGGTSGGYFPTISTSKLQADVSVTSGQTIMLGGLVRTEKSVSDTGIPVLKDIPLIGRYLFGSTENKDDAKELMIFLTPHVVTNSTAAQLDAQRRMENINMDGIWSKGWSNSELAEPPKFGDLLNREYRKQEQLKKEREAEERLQEFEKRHNPDRTPDSAPKNLYKEKYTLPPPLEVKEEQPSTAPEEPQLRTPTPEPVGKPSGAMRLLDDKNGTNITVPATPPPKVTIPAPEAAEPTPTIKAAGQMRVIEEKTEPLLAIPAPAPAKPPAPEAAK